MLRVQQAVGRITPSRSLSAVIRCFENRRLCGWVFDRYLDIAPPAFVADGPRALTRSRARRRRQPEPRALPAHAPGVISRKHMSTRSRSIVRSNSSRPKP